MVRDPSPPAPLSSKPDRIAGLKRDLFYLRRFAHPNIVTVYGAYEESGTLYMVMEYLPHSLRSRAVVAKVDLLRVLSDVARAPCACTPRPRPPRRQGAQRPHRARAQGREAVRLRTRARAPARADANRADGGRAPRRVSPRG